MVAGLAESHVRAAGAVEVYHATALIATMAAYAASTRLVGAFLELWSDWVLLSDHPKVLRPQVICMSYLKP